MCEVGWSVKVAPSGADGILDLEWECVPHATL